MIYSLVVGYVDSPEGRVDFPRQVNAKIACGWELVGGPIAVGKQIVQALVHSSSPHTGYQTGA